MKREEQMAYLAGAMDGDGSFFITKRMSPKYPRYVAGAQIGKSSKELIGLFVSLFSGHADVMGNHSRWSATSDVRVRPFLEAIIPYLVMKKNRAKFLLEWLQGGMNDKQEAYERMKEINLHRDRDLCETSSSVVDEDPVKWSYLAGLMDTDGSFMIHKIMKPTFKNPRHVARVSYGENDARPISFIKKMIPWGSVNKKDYSTCPMGRFCWELVVREEMCEFIRRLLPYLLVKRANAEIVLKFCENVRPVTKGHRFGIPPEEMAFREACYQELQPLQRR